MDAQGWRPIETAPKDGTRVLLVESYEGTPVISVGWWSENVNEGPGWMDGTVQNWGYEEYDELSPTHWQPLPPPPQKDT